MHPDAVAQAFTFPVLYPVPLPEAIPQLLEFNGWRGGSVKVLQEEAQQQRLEHTDPQELQELQRFVQ